MGNRNFGEREKELLPAGQPHYGDTRLNGLKLWIACDQTGTQFLCEGDRKGIRVRQRMNGFDTRCRNDPFVYYRSQPDGKRAEVPQHFFRAVESLLTVHDVIHLADIDQANVQCGSRITCGFKERANRRAA